MHHVDEQTVFIVEDDPDARDSLVDLICSMGHRCEAYESGELFLQSGKGHSPGCAVVDFHLPGISGAEVHCKLASAGSTMPVILTSGALTVRSAVAALQGGVFRVVEKPFFGDELTSAIEEALHWERSFRCSRRYRLDTQQRLESLQHRERTTLALILAGQPNKVIERRLGLSRRTVERIRNGILAKMDTLSFVELAAKLAENQLPVKVENQ